jgi:hypothetical protein
METGYEICYVEYIRCVYRAGSFMTGAKEISKYKLDLVRVHEVIWARGGTEPTGGE